jgi:hypothetical protein
MANVFAVRQPPTDFIRFAIVENGAIWEPEFKNWKSLLKKYVTIPPPLRQKMLRAAMAYYKNEH